MLVLAFDTAGPDCSAAVARCAGGEVVVLARQTERLGRGHAERLIPLIEATLCDAAVDFSELERLLVTTGPGSFTGVRIGIAAARGLALALAIPAVGVGSLAALAEGALRQASAGMIVAALDARRAQVFLGAFRAPSLEVVVPASLLSLEEAADRLSGFDLPLTLTGSAAPLLGPLLGDGVAIGGEAESPDIADVIAAGLRVPAAGAPSPVYVREADAKPQTGAALAHA